MLDFSTQIADPVPLQIERFLRGKIESGELAPGTRLPTTAELAAKWSVHVTSIQQALAPLVAQGLVERRRRHGTFVGNLRRKGTIGLVFGQSLSDETAHFRRAQLQTFRELARERRWTCRVYDGFNPLTGLDQEHRQDVVDQLEADLCNHGFKGLVHIGLRYDVSVDLERRCGLPTVRMEDVSGYDFEGFTGIAAVRLVDQGCRHLAFVLGDMGESAPGEKVAATEAMRAAVRETARSRGLAEPEELHVPWMGSASATEAEVEARTEAAIAAWRAAPGGLPDGWIVPDDIVMRGVATAFLRAGVRIPQDVRVIAEATDRVQLHYGVPVERCVFSVEGPVRDALDALWAGLVGGPAVEGPRLHPGRLVAAFPRQAPTPVATAG